MKVADPRTFLKTLQEWAVMFPDTREAVSRVAPVTDKFSFESTEEFESKAREVIAGYASRWAGKCFHVRVSRRGGKDKLSPYHEEQILGSLALEEVARQGAAAEIEFHDPDFVIAVETLDDQAGMALWSREELSAYPMLKLVKPAHTVGTLQGDWS
jgi:tRNA(Ser,Leu) C12 N-acetylase TAN1